MPKLTYITEGVNKIMLHKLEALEQIRELDKEIRDVVVKFHKVYSDKESYELCYKDLKNMREVLKKLVDLSEWALAHSGDPEHQDRIEEVKPKKKRAKKKGKGGTPKKD